MIRLSNNEIVRALGMLIALLVLKGVQAADWAPPAVRTLTSTLANRELNQEARAAQTAGYYEGLIDEGARVSAMNRLISGSRRITFEDRAQPDRRETHDFRFYELIPDSEIPDYSDSRQRYQLKTNSAGFADREYTVEKAAGVRRLALMGDSVTRGQGAPFQGTYEALLERRLNDDTRGAPAVEILNFAVGSYNATQSMETAKVKAAPYRPDVYVFPLSKLSVYRGWAQHIALLLNAGIDLKYDYLRRVVRDAGVKPDDPINVFQAKMARFRVPTIKWALTEVQAHAASEGAAVLVLLIPTVEDVSVLEEEFLGVPEILTQLRIPYVDLLDTFKDVDLAKYRVADNDTHPNAEGHQLLYENLYRQLTHRPDLLQLVLGGPARLDLPAR